MNWDEYFFNLAKAVAEKSKDQSVKVGTVIVGPDRDIRATGWNGFPRGVMDDPRSARNDRPDKYLWTEHAERNAIFNAARVGTPLQGCSIYLDWYPCSRCARAIIQSGIVEVVVDGRGYDKKEKSWDERWKHDCDVGQQMLRETNVKVRIALSSATGRSS